jgi:hypothetical protein
MNITRRESITPNITSINQCIVKYITDIITEIMEKIRKYEYFIFFVKIPARVINMDIATCKDGKQLF